MELSVSEQAGDVPAMLAAAEAVDPSRPLLTFYDDATGARVELSAAALSAWGARTANLLVEGCGLGHGARAALLLPPHWQTAAVLLGAWTAGVSVAFHSTATAGLPQVGPGSDQPVDVTFAALDRLDNWLEDVPEARHRFVLDLASTATRPRRVPADFRDYLTEVRRYGDSFQPGTPIYSADPATVDGTTYREWGSLVREMAAIYDIGPGDRVLINAAEHEHPLKWLLTPLTAGASVVLCVNLDPGKVTSRTRFESITRVL